MIHFTRSCAMIAAFMLAAIASNAQDEVKKKAPPRFGFPVDEMTFPQKTPKDAMNSIVLALNRKKVDYMLAHMADPLLVEYWIERYQGDFPEGKDEARRLLAFDRLVRETSEYYLNDPLILKDLRVFAKDAKWEEMDDIAVGTTDKVAARKVYLKKIGDRWFLENRQQ
jgi:hypothetical protein